MTIEIYTDGCCLNNQSAENRGGWALIVVEDGVEKNKMSNGIINTTNQRMELTACIAAMMLTMTEFPNEDVSIITDSAYVVNCVKDGWYLKWQQNSWFNSKNEAVKNQDLWKVFIEYLEQKYFKFIHIKGHAGHKWNERADQFAKRAAITIPEGDCHRELMSLGEFKYE